MQAGMPLGSWLAARTGRKALIIPGLVLSHISFACLAFVDTREAFYALLLLSSLSSAVIGPALGAFTAEVLPRTQRGQANAVSRTSGDISSLMAPIALGILVRSTWRSNARVLCTRERLL
jgi:MFS family permease